VAKYKTKGLDCWEKAKELRAKYYKDYKEAHDRGALRWEGELKGKLMLAPFYGAK
jgi:hypothetical protein